MVSLFKVQFNWLVYILLMVFIRLSWVDMSWYSFFALAITLHQFLLLFFSMGSVIPIRYLAGAFMCLQMLLGPTFAYNGLDAYQFVGYKMRIPEAQYFQYVIPAMILFIFGLHVTAKKLQGEVLALDPIRDFVDSAGSLPYIFIVVGFLASIVAGFFGSALSFVFILLGNFKFIGLFMLLLGSKKLQIGVLILVFSSIIASSLGQAMFHDLLTWLIMAGAVLAIKYRPSMGLKVALCSGFIILAVVIQLLKGDYRKTAQVEGGNAESLEKVYDNKREGQGLFNFNSLAENNVRINQGFIITNIMQRVPDKVPFENGAELVRILEAAFLPRILAPNKLNAGDRTIFMKYSGMQLREGTSMGLSSVGDGYINFGITGGCIFMFFLGLLFSEVLNGFYKYSKYYPVLLLFTPLVFYYPIRPDCELQTSLGHLVKSCMLLYGIFLIWKYQFKGRMKKTASLVSDKVTG